VDLDSALLHQRAVDLHAHGDVEVDVIGAAVDHDVVARRDALGPQDRPDLVEHLQDLLGELAGIHVGIDSR
jgi:hypothetical protein